MIIDHHVHLGRDLKTGFSLSPEQLLKKMDAFGIDSSVVFACPNKTKKQNPYEEDNNQIANWSERNPRLIPFMFVHPFLDNIEYIKSNHSRFRGFKIYATAKGMEYDYSQIQNQEIFQFIMQTRKPILFHTGKIPGSRVRDLLGIIKATQQPIALAHSGRLFKEDLEKAAEQKNVYLDISPLATNIHMADILYANQEERPKLKTLTPEVVIEYLENLFQGRIVWGTDTPWCDHLIPNGYEQEIKIRKLLKNPNKTFLNQ